MAMPLDVWADVSCPWCYLGHRRLARALEAEPPGSVEVRHRSFLLQPDVPPEGLDFREYMARRFSSPEAMGQALQRVVDEGAGEGMRFDFAAIGRAPNTVLAHGAVQLGGVPVLHELFAGYFE